MCVPVDGGGPGVDGADAAVAAGAVGPDDEGGVVVGGVRIVLPRQLEPSICDCLDFYFSCQTLDLLESSRTINTSRHVLLTRRFLRVGSFH